MLYFSKLCGQRPPPLFPTSPPPPLSLLHPPSPSPPLPLPLPLAGIEAEERREARDQARALRAIDEGETEGDNAAPTGDPNPVPTLTES